MKRLSPLFLALVFLIIAACGLGLVTPQADPNAFNTMVAILWDAKFP